MGDRISIQFKNGKDYSGVLFSHWDGLLLRDRAEAYIYELINRNLKKSKDGKLSSFYPLDRLQPDTIMVSFISEIIGQGKQIESNYYLPTDVDMGDNSDNGHHTIDITMIKDLVTNAYETGKQQATNNFEKEIED